jgi:exopolyphosphatase/guanosine-5'-triphosphate,3'-diphosphate pyrophosphatase
MNHDDLTSIAAVDLGSNSFHMIVADAAEGRLKTVDRMRTMVRLAAGLGDDNSLSEGAMNRAIECLGRFAERLRDFDSDNVRVVGTNTLRRARNGRVFMARAEAALGYPIDVISGREEARLIYLGVSHGLEDESDMRLVIDIGGGSTELILGRHFDPLIMESLHMGCVDMSNAVFADGKITRELMLHAELNALQELEPIEASYRENGWQSVIGASGTNVAIRDVVAANGWSKDGITKASLDRLRDAIVAAGHIDKLNLAGLSDERRVVFPGGVAILTSIFNTFSIEHMRVSSSALREGLLYDLLGRIQHEDVREQSVDSLIDRYGIDRGQSHRVFLTAKRLWQQTAANWDLDGEDVERFLRWACALHEIGSAIAHSQYHKHGGYLLAHLDMAGFSRGEQRRLAVLVRGHRRKFPIAEFETLPRSARERLKRICVLLRLAVVLHRRRSERILPDINMKVEEQRIRLRVPKNWLEAHQLTAADLDQEASYLKAAGYRLKIR